MNMQSIQNEIKFLAKEAADYWNNLTDEQKDEYMDNGTSTVFEDVDLPVYMTIVHADKDGELLGELEDEFWNLAED